MNKVSIWCSAILCFAFAAPTTVSANVIATTQFGTGDFGFESDQQILTSGTAHAESFLDIIKLVDDEPTLVAEGNAKASASLGTLKSFVSLQVVDPLLYMGSAHSGFDDVLSIVLFDNDDIALAPDTPGFADIRVAYNWSLFGSGSAQIVLSFAGGAAGASESDGQSGAGGDPLLVNGTVEAIDAVLGDFFTVRVPIASADTFSVILDLIAHVGIVGPDGGRVDASQSAYWGGILAVRDSDLNIVPFSVTSASGTDYRRSFDPDEVVPTVPEPATLSLLCCGFVFLLGRRVRRGRRLLVT